jgi:hypothetical protein
MRNAHPSTMPKYYLHLWDGDLFEADQEGTDLPDLASAREEALRFANEIRCDLEAPDRALIQIADAAGSVLWMIQLSRTADRPRCRG